MATPEPLRASAAPALAQLLAAALLGLVALPSLAAAGPGDADPAPGTALIWLGAGLLVTVWLLAITPALTRSLGDLLARVQLRQAAQPAPRDGRGASRLAPWVVAGGDVVLIQATLRRPLVAALGPSPDSSSVEALFAAFALAALLLVLYLLHRTARPVVEGAAWYALDSLVATSGPESAPPSETPAGETRRATPAPGADATRPAGPGPDAAATLAASSAAAEVEGPHPSPLPEGEGEADARGSRPAHGDETLPAPTRAAVGAATLPAVPAAPAPEANATPAAEPAPAADATVVAKAGRTPSSGDVTQPGGPPDDRTVSLEPDDGSAEPGGA